MKSAPFQIAGLDLSSVRAEVDLDALRHNIRVLRDYSGDAEIMAAVKADGYGHGAVRVAKAAASENVRHFGVATVLEGIELREAGIDAAIYVYGAPREDVLSAYVRHQLVATVSSVEVAEAIVAMASQTGPLTVHIKVDTGMHRLGLLPEEVPDVLHRLRATPGVSVEGIWTHFATVDHAFTREQLRRFDELLGTLADPPPVTHVANSGTLLHLPETSRGRTLVRAGGALYGLVIDRLPGVEIADFRAVMRLVSSVVHLRTVNPGETVSYGRTWKAQQSTRIATIAAGYGDGIPRSLSNCGSVGIRGAIYPIVGRVCMDMLMVDIGAEGSENAVCIGDEVVLFGTGGPDAVELAKKCGTIAYELTCGLTQRVRRVYTGDESDLLDT